MLMPFKLIGQRSIEINILSIRALSNIIFCGGGVRRTPSSFIGFPCKMWQEKIQINRNRKSEKQTNLRF